MPLSADQKEKINGAILIAVFFAVAYAYNEYKPVYEPTEQELASRPVMFRASQNGPVKINEKLFGILNGYDGKEDTNHSLRAFRRNDDPVFAEVPTTYNMPVVKSSTGKKYAETAKLLGATWGVLTQKIPTKLEWKEEIGEIGSWSDRVGTLVIDNGTDKPIGVSVNDKRMPQVGAYMHSVIDFEKRDVYQVVVKSETNNGPLITEEFEIGISKYDYEFFGGNHIEFNLYNHENKNSYVYQIVEYR